MQYLVLYLFFLCLCAFISMVFPSGILGYNNCLYAIKTEPHVMIVLRACPLCLYSTVSTFFFGDILTVLGSAS